MRQECFITYCPGQRTKISSWSTSGFWETQIENHEISSLSHSLYRHDKNALNFSASMRFDRMGAHQLRYLLASQFRLKSSFGFKYSAQDAIKTYTETWFDHLCRTCETTEHQISLNFKSFLFCILTKISWFWTIRHWLPEHECPRYTVLSGHFTSWR
jgi:hypothetical protein